MIQKLKHMQRHINYIIYIKIKSHKYLIYLFLVLILINSCHHDIQYEYNIKNISSGCDSDGAGFPEMSIYYSIKINEGDTLKIIEKYKFPNCSWYNLDWGIPLEFPYIVIDKDTLYGRHSYVFEKEQKELDTLCIGGKNNRDYIFTISAFEMWDLYERKYDRRFSSISSFMRYISRKGYLVYESKNRKGKRCLQKIRIIKKVNFFKYDDPLKGLFEDDYESN